MICVACYNSVQSLENLNWLDGLASIVLGFWMDCAMKNEIVLRKITQMSHDTWFCKMISPNCPTYIASSTTCCPVSLKKQILEHWTPWHHMEWKRTINNQIITKSQTPISKLTHDAPFKKYSTFSYFLLSLSHPSAVVVVQKCLIKIYSC